LAIDDQVDAKLDESISTASDPKWSQASFRKSIKTSPLMCKIGRRFFARSIHCALNTLRAQTKDLASGQNEMPADRSRILAPLLFEQDRRLDDLKAKHRRCSLAGEF